MSSTTGEMPVMEVEAGGKRLRLAVDQPQRILPPGSAPRDFTCGRQNTPGRIGYVTAGKPAGTDGFLRLADLK